MKRTNERQNEIHHILTRVYCKALTTSIPLFLPLSLPTFTYQLVPKSLDLILDTIPAEHDVGPYLKLLANPGKGNCRHVCIGATTDLIAGIIAFKNGSSSPVVHSLIGSIVVRLQCTTDLYS